MDDSDLSNILNDNITISGGVASSGTSYTITLDPSLLTSTTSSVYLGNTGAVSGTYTIGTSSDSINISDILKGWDSTPFEDGFPDWNDFQKMCEEYPGLKIAYEHMKVFYKLSIDDWKSKKEGEGNV
jgi:hypothetical protein